MSQRFFITAEATYESLRQRLDTALGYPNALGSSVIQPPIHAPRDAYRRVLIAVDSALQGYATIIAAIESLVATDAMEELDEATYLAAASSQIPIVVTLAEVTTTANYGSTVLGNTPAEDFLAQLVTNGLADAIDAVGGLPFATANAPGAIAIGTGLAIDGNGVVSVTGSYTLPTATATVLGGVKIGSGISIDGNGVISASAGYTLPNATTSTLGGVIVGSGLSVSSGTISVITYTVRSDTVGSTTYTGRAVSGSATSASVWTIRRTILTSAGAVSSTATATNVKWDDRLTASYS